MAVPAGRVAIVGGGFSGAMTAVNLARFGGPVATIFERTGIFGPGVAFGGADRGQVLNVPAGNMSAYPDDPQHFQRWLALNGLADDGFARRTDYGRYLAEEISAAKAERPGRIQQIAEEAIVARRVGNHWEVTGDGGTQVQADVLVLASGLAPPTTPVGIEPSTLPARCWIGDPWRDDFLEAHNPEAPVLLIGTGLTMVDVALALADQPRPPPIHAVSRRGLLPRPHTAGGYQAKLAETPDLGVAQLVNATRRVARDIGWRAAIDRLRPHTQTIWQRFSPLERRRFLRHLRPFWDVHRHRMAPELAAQIEALVESGALTIHAGRIETVVRQGARVRVAWQPRGTAARVALDFDRIVNCTGPAPLDHRNAGPLTAQLLASGAIAKDAYGLGVEVDAQSRAIGASGKADETLYALGALTRGKFWEISAVPDIRVQAWQIARKLSNAHWVGGEGL